MCVWWGLGGMGIVSYCGFMYLVDRALATVPSSGKRESPLAHTLLGMQMRLSLFMIALMRKRSNR